MPPRLSNTSLTLWSEERTTMIWVPKMREYTGPYSCAHFWNCKWPSFLGIWWRLPIKGKVGGPGGQFLGLRPTLLHWTATKNKADRTKRTPVNDAMAMIQRRLKFGKETIVNEQQKHEDSQMCEDIIMVYPVQMENMARFAWVSSYIWWRGKTLFIYPNTIMSAGYPPDITLTIWLQHMHVAKSL